MPKRHRGESSRQATSYDKKRFISADVETYYNGVIETKKLIPERGLNPSMRDGHLWQMIGARRWELLVSQPEAAVVSIVKEFYANAKDIKHNEVYVRGKTVSFSAEAINAIYGLHEPTEMDDYSIYATGPINYDELIQGLCQPDATWKMKNGEHKHFSYTFLSSYGKAWYYFITAKLMPTTHITEVIKDRAVLLHCIVNEMSINIGKVINSSIKYALQKGPARGLPHPSLICRLCEEAGVTWDDNEFTQEPQVVIDSKIIRSYQQWGGAPPDPKGAGFLLGAVPSPDTEELFADPPEPDTASSSHSINMIVDEMRQLRRENRRQARMNAHMAQMMTSMMQYNVAIGNSLAEAFQRLGANDGHAPLQFPEPPLIPPPPPDSPDAEDA